MSLWFVVPAHGRHDLTNICLRQLRRTCDRLTDAGTQATAVVIACDENLDTARELGFGTVERDNRFLSRRFNDGIQLALDPAHNPRPADHVVPCGSDDWAHPSLFDHLPADDQMIGFQNMCFVREDGLEVTARRISYPGGCGIRIYPRSLMATLGYRPADEDRVRGCDTSILYNLRRANPTMRIVELAPDPWKIVDWKTRGEQVTPYDHVGQHPPLWQGDPFDQLNGHWDTGLLTEMRSPYQRDMVAA